MRKHQDFEAFVLQLSKLYNHWFPTKGFDRLSSIFQIAQSGNN